MDSTLIGGLLASRYFIFLGKKKGMLGADSRGMKIIATILYLYDELEQCRCIA